MTVSKLMGAALLITLFSCNTASNKDKNVDLSIAPVTEATTKTSEIPVTNEQQFADTVQASQQSVTPAPSTQQSPPVKNEWSKKLVKTAQLNYEVKDSKKYGQFVDEKLKEYGAYIAEEDDNIRDERRETLLKIKVPVQYFDPLIAALGTGDVKVIQKSIRTQEVTGDMVDTRARMEAKKEMRLKYLEFLKGSKNMTEALQVQSEINSIQEEIESASGRYTSLSNQAAYSNIDLAYGMNSIEPVIKTDKPGYGSRLLASLKSGGSWFSELLVIVLTIWPVILVLAIGYWVTKRYRSAKVVDQKL